jgi:glycosyltransferase involved in cell wall biosynthesis
MKVAWLTPLSSRSAIGKVAVHVAEHLRRHVDVDLWCSDRDGLHATDVPIVRYEVSDAFERLLGSYDAVLYNFGDNYPFHRDVFLMSRRVPGIAILHDFVLHHFFMGYYLEEPERIEHYLRAIEHHYGPEARAEAEASFDRAGPLWMLQGTRTPLWETDRVVDYPLFEEALRHVTGVVVHSEFLARKVRRATDAPVRHLHLPAVQTAAASDSRPGRPDIPSGRALLLTIGYVNPNKRAAEVVEVLGRNPDLAARVTYIVVGELPPGDYPRRLRDTIARFGLESTVRLMGRRTDQELRAWLHHADVCLNLRHPVMEGASASLADALRFGKPVVVTNAGAYAEVPSDCVAKVDPGREADQLPTVLRTLLDDPIGRQAMADRGRSYAEEHFRADRYADGLAQFVSESGGFGVMVRYAHRVGSVMRQMGFAAGLPIIDTVARESADLFGTPVTSPWRPGRDRE